MGDNFYSIVADSSNQRYPASTPQEDPIAPTVPEALPEQNGPRGPLATQPTNRIVALAKPKSCLAANRNKKKVVAFGKTTNLSQTVEGTALRDPKQRHISQPKTKTNNHPAVMNNKENAANTTRAVEPRTPMILREMPNMQVNEEAAGNGDQMGAFMAVLRQMFTEQEKKLVERDQKMDRQMGQLRQELQTQLTSFESRLTNNQPSTPLKGTPQRRLEGLDSRVGAIKLHTPRSSDGNILKSLDAVELGVEKDPTLFAVVRKWYTALSRKHEGPRLESVNDGPGIGIDCNVRGAGTITEKLTMERTRPVRPQYSSPSGQPFSISSVDFLNRSGLLPGQSRRARSPVLESMCPREASRDYRTHVPVHQLPSDEYDNYARARERGLPSHGQYDYEEEFNDEDFDSMENREPVVREPDEDRRMYYKQMRGRNQPR